MTDEAKDTQAQDAEEKPKRRRRTRAKSEGKAAESKPEAASKRPRRTRAKAKAEETKADASKEQAATADEVKAEEAEAEAPKATPTRRGGAEAPATAALVRARARYVRTSARKARLVCDHIRGKSVEEARAILDFAPREAARDWSKLLESAVANAEHNHELVGDELKIKDAHADEGPTLKRYRPRAMGRATQIRKRTAHLSITLTPDLERPDA
ncbi:MAG: large subunit ribosomal protein [Solirubrobacteraceae bacterium]|jgi:ribosomal protein L22|nr:large subunit ribosomal protein [Solirubrobacteraceae bacterium]